MLSLFAFVMINQTLWCNHSRISRPPYPLIGGNAVTGGPKYSNVATVFVCLSPQTKLQLPKLKYETLEICEVLSIHILFYPVICRQSSCWRFTFNTQTRLLLHKRIKNDQAMLFHRWQRQVMFRLAKFSSSKKPDLDPKKLDTTDKTYSIHIKYA